MVMWTIWKNKISTYYIRRKWFRNEPFSSFLKKIKKIKKKGLHSEESSYILILAVTLIAMKREVAATLAGFPWSECQVRKLTTSHCTSSETINGMDVCKEVERHTRRCVQSPLVVLHN